MRQPVPRGNRKKVEKPVIITSNNQFTPKISERTLKKRKEAKENQLNPGRYASGLDTCGIACLYTFLVLCVLIGGGGIGVCAYYFNTSSSTQGWKIGGIAMGAVTLIIGIILILLTIFKQARNRPWKYKKKETLVTNDYYGDFNDDDDDQMNIQNFDDNPTRKSVVIIRRNSMEERKSVSQSPIIHSAYDDGTREIATSPLPNLSAAPTQFKTLTSDLIFCPGCNRSHPSAHQCMYSTRLANGFATQIRPVAHAPHKDSIAIQTDDDGQKKKKSKGPHTLIDRSLKYSNTTETQTNVTANPKSNITESVILKRVPIPTAKVVVQQPTTKVMIVKVPNVAGQLVIQPKTEPNGEQLK